jgi:SAM-dependent methyltransferase
LRITSSPRDFDREIREAAETERTTVRHAQPISPGALFASLASLPPGARDAALEKRLRIGGAPNHEDPPGPGLIGYHPSGVAPIVRALAEVPVGPDDVFVDLGSGLGKVVILAALLTGAFARGIEVQQPLVARARRTARRLGVDVRFTCADMRDADLRDGTVFYLYAPCGRPALRPVLDRLHAVAQERTIVVCALGIDLDGARWLVNRGVDAFWLSIYESAIPHVAPRERRRTSPLSPQALAVAFERRG